MGWLICDAWTEAIWRERRDGANYLADTRRVNFQVLRRTQASLGHKEGVDPKVAADQRGHAIGVAIDTYTESDLESRWEVVTKLERALADRKPPERVAKPKSSGKPGFRGKRGKTG